MRRGPPTTRQDLTQQCCFSETGIQDKVPQRSRLEWILFEEHQVAVKDVNVIVAAQYPYIHFQMCCINCFVWYNITCRIISDHLWVFLY